jgi:hypothetical protein
VCAEKANVAPGSNERMIARQAEVAGIGEPVIRQNSWDSTVAIPIGKPTVVGSSDDLDSKGKLQVEVTATRVE